MLFTDFICNDPKFAPMWPFLLLDTENVSFDRRINIFHKNTQKQDNLSVNSKGILWEATYCTDKINIILLFRNCMMIKYNIHYYTLRHQLHQLQQLLLFRYNHKTKKRLWCMCWLRNQKKHLKLLFPLQLQLNQVNLKFTSSDTKRYEVVCGVRFSYTYIDFNWHRRKKTVEVHTQTVDNHKMVAILLQHHLRLNMGLQVAEPTDINKYMLSTFTTYTTFTSFITKILLPM